ncbi:MAG: TatD family hydrolase [Polyangiaceae bacterium]
MRGELIDSHCHLDPEYFPEGPTAIMDRARGAGVGHFVVIGVGQTTAAARLAVSLAETHGDVSATVGMHPHDARLLDDTIAAELAELAARPEVVAVGEVGLDHHYMHSPAEAQEEVFRRMVDLARALHKPIVVHTRSAAEQTLAILEASGAREVGGIIHCFSEDRAFARRALDLDFDLSFSGIVTFKSAKSIQDVARWAPPDRILVETDAPYLAPIPLRGKRNEPAHVVLTARYVAELRGETYEDFAARTVRATAARLRLAVDRDADGPQVPELGKT